MKFQKYNQLGLKLSEFKDDLYKCHSENFFSKLDKDFVKPYQEQWKWILSDDKNKNLYFTHTAIKVADAIKVIKFRPEILKTQKEIKYTFLIDEKCFYRTVIKDGEIFALRVYLQGNIIKYDSFKIKPNEDLVVYPKNQESYMNDINFVQFIKLLIFTEYSDLKETVLMPKQRYGTNKQGKYLNETDKNIIIVDSTWNSVMVRNDSFGVNGHFRLQPKGKNRKEIKLIYIKEYRKNGYLRKSKKEQISSK